MRASTSSASSPVSKIRWRNLDVAIAAALALCVASISLLWFFRHSYLLYYGDAQAHLNISRSVVDSRTPGYEQFGTVWLPLLHLICLPLVKSDRLWANGLAGALPVSCCLVVAAASLYWVARHVFQSRIAGAVVVCCLLSNPNLLYLAATPMTEVLFIAALSIFLCSALQDRWMSAIVACWAMCFTRYDGWFLLPFAAAWFYRPGRIARPLAFLAVASLAPLVWIAHNFYETGNALDFFNGPYSAKVIQGDAWYPGLHDWAQAVRYYLEAGRLCSGWGLLACGVVGFFCIANAPALRVAGMLSLTPLFYIWSMHSSGNPVRVPTLPPHDYYNGRYGIAVTLWAAFCAGAIATVSARRARLLAATVLLVATIPWLLGTRENWILWKESEVNSHSRRAWTRVTAGFLHDRYQSGQGILAPFGDLTGVFGRAGIPLREVLHEGNGPQWLANISGPAPLHTETWALGIARSFGPDYQPVLEVNVKGAPPVLLYHRRH